MVGTILPARAPPDAERTPCRTRRGTLEVKPSARPIRTPTLALSLARARETSEPACRTGHQLTGSALPSS